MTQAARAITAVATACLLLTLAACDTSEVHPDAGSTAPASTPSPEPSPTAPGPPVAAVDPGAYPTYVALGDSFTAAPLASKTRTTDGCLRSRHNYPALIAAALKRTHLEDRSCSGADTTSLIGVQQTLGGLAPAQFDALSENTSLVTIGIGGNDFSIYGTLLGTCPSLRHRDPTGAPCRKQLTSRGTDRLLAHVAELGPRMTAIIAGIRDRSPNAEIVVVGYPNAIPAVGTCPDLPLAEGDYAYAANVNATMARTQKRAAQRAGATYIDVYAASKGHDICSDDPWVNGSVTSADTALAYHPLIAEQRAVAQLVLDALPPHGPDAG